MAKSMLFTFDHDFRTRQQGGWGSISSFSDGSVVVQSRFSVGEGLVRNRRKPARINGPVRIHTLPVKQTGLSSGGAEKYPLYLDFKSWVKVNL